MLSGREDSWEYSGFAHSWNSKLEEQDYNRQNRINFALFGIDHKASNEVFNKEHSETRGNRHDLESRRGPDPRLSTPSEP